MAFLYDFYWLFVWTRVRSLRATFSGHFFTLTLHTTILHKQEHICRRHRHMHYRTCMDMRMYCIHCICLHDTTCHCVPLHDMAQIICAWVHIRKIPICHCMTYHYNVTYQCIWHCITTYTSRIPAWLYDPAGFYAAIKDCTMHPNTSMDTLGIEKSIFCQRSARIDHEVARRAPSAVDYERIPGLQVSRAEEDLWCKMDGSCAPPDCCCKSDTRCHSSLKHDTGFPRNKQKSNQVCRKETVLVSTLICFRKWSS